MHVVTVMLLLVLQVISCGEFGLFLITFEFGNGHHNYFHRQHWCGQNLFGIHMNHRRRKLVLFRGALMQYIAIPLENLSIL